MSIYSGTNLLICFNILMKVNILSLDILSTDSPPIIKIIKNSIKTIKMTVFEFLFQKVVFLLGTSLSIFIIIGLRGRNCMLTYLVDQWTNRMINWCIFVWHTASGHNSITKGRKLEEKQIKNFKRRPIVYFECHICKYIC